MSHHGHHSNLALSHSLDYQHSIPLSPPSPATRVIRPSDRTEGPGLMGCLALCDSMCSVPSSLGKKSLHFLRASPSELPTNISGQQAVYQVLPIS